MIHNKIDFNNKINIFQKTEDSLFPQKQEDVNDHMNKNKISILVVDEQLEIRAFLKTFLENKGFEILTASSTDEAMVQLDNHRPDILIVDALLSDETALLNLQHAQNIPVIFISAIPLNTLLFRQKVHYSKKKITTLNPVPFLEKPLQEDELSGLITALTGAVL